MFSFDSFCLEAPKLVQLVERSFYFAENNNAQHTKREEIFSKDKTGDNNTQIKREIILAPLQEKTTILNNSRTGQQGVRLARVLWDSQSKHESFARFEIDIFTQQYASDDTDTSAILDWTPMINDTDPHASISHSGESLNHFKLEFHILFSIAYICPVLYFNLYQNGKPLSSSEMKTCSISTRFHPRLFELITQAEHPVLEIPFYFIHPCNTTLLMKQVQKSGKEPQKSASFNTAENHFPKVGPYQTWFSIVAPLLGIRIPSKAFLDNPMVK